MGVIERQTGSISEITAFTVTVERLIPGGDTWWVTRYTEQLLDPNPDLSSCPILIIDKI